jgi:hypothetical protein
MEIFVCNVYSSKGSCVTVLKLRWELFKTKDFEGEKLPPVHNTLKPHIQRVNSLKNGENLTKSQDQSSLTGRTMDGNIKLTGSSSL